jgi:L-iditol 2-dehydrogenase
MTARQDSTGGQVPETMRASVLTGAKQIAMEQRVTPRPRPGEVLVRVTTVGVCGIGRALLPQRAARTVRRRRAAHPRTRIVRPDRRRRATGVAADRLGERVAIEPQRPCRVCGQCKAGRYNLCPYMEFYATPPIDGAFCDYVTIQADFAHPVPDAVSDEAAALLEPLSVGIAAARKGGGRARIPGADRRVRADRR